MKNAVKDRLLRVPAGPPEMLYGYRGLEHARVSSSTIFHVNPDNVRLADHVFVWHYTILDGSDVLTIEEGAQIGAWVGLFTHSSHIAIRLQGEHYKGFEGDRPGWVQQPLTIGPYAFIGAGSTVLPGANVGRAALVSAQSLVTKPVPDYAIVAGAPAKVIGDVRDIDKQYLGDDVADDYAHVTDGGDAWVVPGYGRIA
jgi:acetyltransferase-like isoleucine patch superfamily enzyme